MAQYWLMKSEPNAYSIDDLKREKSTHWDGVRNYQARNIMRDKMKKGDRVLFYHSNAKPPGVAGTAVVVGKAYPDHTARVPDSKYYDPRATEENPRWFMVDIQFEEKFPHLVPLPAIRETRTLQNMVLVNRSRLSVQPVTEAEFEKIVAMGHEKEG